MRVFVEVNSAGDLNILLIMINNYTTFNLHRCILKVPIFLSLGAPYMWVGIPYTPLGIVSR
jgi:hypothetical protein